MRLVIYTYILLSIIFLAGVGLSFYGYSYAGYYTDKIIGWLWLLLSVVMIARFWKRSITKVIAGGMLVLLLLSLMPMLVPFYGMVYYFSTMGNKQRITLNNQYRIERTRRGALAMEEMVVYKRWGILEQRISVTPWSDVAEEIMHVLPEYFYKANPGIERARLLLVHKDSIGIVYTIDGITEVFYHKLSP